MSSYQYEPTISLWDNEDHRKITLKNRKTGEEFSFELQHTCVVGRKQEACDIQITTEDRYISGRHVMFSLDGSTVYAEDLKTKNGTRLNGNPLTAKKQVRHGDMLRMGRSEFEIRM
ncbi:MAG: FHA domain-containing protein [Lachnospiraceae bacterium]|nr:FHA domain-containing protein [Lachnospiraceae bacterium]